MSPVNLILEEDFLRAQDGRRPGQYRLFKKEMCNFKNGKLVMINNATLKPILRSGFILLLDILRMTKTRLKNIIDLFS